MVTNDGIIFLMEQTSKMENLFLAGKLIIAMPAMSDPRFKRSVVCICAHNEDGAIGIIINKIIESLSFSKIIKQLKLKKNMTKTITRITFISEVPLRRSEDLFYIVRTILRKIVLL